MQYRTTTATGIPILLILIGTFSYLVVKKNWNFEMASYAIFLFVLIYILVLERIIPLKQEWKPKKSILWIDLKHFVFSAAIFDALGKTVALSFVIYLQKHFFSTTIFWDTLPFLATYILANIIGEFLPYIYHRISHKGNQNSFFSLFLWKIHSIHHLPTSLNWFKTNWIHPINMLLNTILKVIPLLILGFNEEIIFLVGVTHITIAYISHANIKTVKSFWDYLIVTPQVHHFHHGKKMEEAKNFGNIIPFWDLLFNTYYNRKGQVEKVGIVENTKMNYPKDKEYLKQLVFPITISKNCCKQITKTD